MSINLTNTEVFDFMSTGTQQRTNYSAAMTALIANVENQIEQFIGRKISKTAVDIKIHNGRYSAIIRNKIFLTNIYYDIYDITTLTEDDISLTEDTDYVRTTPNILERINTIWSRASQLNIEITGFMGLIDPNDTTKTLPAIKQIAIEACAVKSGLWGKVIDDGEGNTFQMIKSNLPKITMQQLERFMLPVVT
ncbi:MAG: hypothetical protein GY756_10015 [bacterium]|nr:hypothetical protein [bacterium]